MNTQSSITTDTAPKLLSASFNQDQGCFTISYETGFRVYNSDPMELNVKREWDPHHTSSNRSSNRPGSAPSTPTKPSARDDTNKATNGASETGGGIGLAQMLHRTNYLALVGGGRNPKFPQNKVVIWDDLKRRPALSLEFLSPVLNVLLSRTHIVVVLSAKVHVFAFSSPPVRIASYETADNPYGVAVLANNVLAFPSRLDGQIQVVNLDTHSNNANVPGQQQRQRSMSPSSRSPSASPRDSPLQIPQQSPAAQPQQHGNLVTIIRAHKGPIRCLALNRTGTVIASASEMGTIIRLHSTKNTALLHEYRRGLDRAIIYSMAFSPCLSPSSPLRLAVLSDKNTLHVFDATSIVGGAAVYGNGNSSGTPGSSPVNINNSNGSSAGLGSLSSSPSSSIISNNRTPPASVIGSPASQAPSTGASNAGNGGIMGTLFSATAAVTSNRRHLLSKLPLMPRYFYSEWSFVSARVDGQAGVLGWAKDDSVVVIWTDSCKWEKYVIVEKEVASQQQPQNGYSDGHAQNDSNHERFELVREAWRGFEGISYD